MGLIFTLRRGDRDVSVCNLQNKLVEAGYSVGRSGVDGTYGPQTEAAVRHYQRDVGLVADGICGPKTWAHLTGHPLPKTLSQNDLVQAARFLGIDVPTLMAVNEVESAGHGFIGFLPVVLFERHIMYRQLKRNGHDADLLEQEYPRLVNPRPGGYQGGTAENKRLQKARDIDEKSALESASYGLFQIMGFHATRIGYDSVTDYMKAMRTSEQDQMHAFVLFVMADDTLRDALKHKNWPAFARHYNGPNYEANDYDHRLAAAYRRHVRHQVHIGEI